MHKPGSALQGVRRRRVLRLTGICLVAMLVTLTVSASPVQAKSRGVGPMTLTELSTNRMVTPLAPYEAAMQRYVLMPLRPGSPQEFWFLPDPDGSYRIESAASGQCLQPDLSGGRGGNGGPLASIIQTPWCSIVGLPQTEWRLHVRQDTLAVNAYTHECLRDVADRLVQDYCPASLATAPSTERWGPGLYSYGNDNIGHPASG